MSHDLTQDDIRALREGRSTLEWPPPSDDAERLLALSPETYSPKEGERKVYEERKCKICRSPIRRWSLVPISGPARLTPLPPTCDRCQGR